jgi:transcriptional regulator with XRE-family HTH domain
MTPAAFRAALASLRWTQRGLAAALGVDERQVRRWAAGATVPPAVAAWLTKAAAWMDRNPPPSRPSAPPC